MDIPEQAVEKATASIFCHAQFTGDDYTARQLARDILTAAQSHMGIQRPEDVARVICERMDDDIRRADKYPMCPCESGCACWGAAAAVLALPHTGQPQEGRKLEAVLTQIKTICEDNANATEWGKALALSLVQQIATNHLSAPQAGCAKEAERKSHAELLAEARAAADRLLDWCDYNEVCWGAWGDQIVYPSVTALTEQAKRICAAFSASPPPPVAESK